MAEHETMTRSQVVTVIEDLAAREASGILRVAGSPAGAIYLDGGRIVFARASWVPGLTARLRGIRPASADLAGLPSGPEADDAAIAGFALQRGYLTMDELNELIRSIVIDAFLVLTIPLAADSHVTDIRFTSMPGHWTHVFPRFGIDLVRGETLRAAERIADHRLPPTVEVARCDLRKPVAVVTREQWAAVCQIGGRVSARDLAARRGTPLVETLECLGSLVTAGLCTPVRAAGELGQRPALKAGGEALAASPAANRPLPARSPGQEYAAYGMQAGDPGNPPTADLLRQVLDGLRKLG